jgi:flagellar hook protein FlgE
MNVAMRIDSSLAGIQANAMLFDRAANKVANVNSEDRDPPVDLADEVPAMDLAEIGYTASARAIRWQDETTQSLIDVLG